MKCIIRLSALYLLWFVLVFSLVVTDLRWNYLSEGIRNFLARYPFQWDYEFQFTVLFAVWGFFLWRAADQPSGMMVRFSALAFVTQGIATVILALLRPGETTHLLLDSTPWLILGIPLMTSFRSQTG